MPPVVQEINTNTNSTFLSASRAATEVGIMIQTAMQAWITAVNEPDRISLVGNYSTATTWNTNPTALMVGVEKDATGGAYTYGARWYKLYQTNGGVWYYDNFYAWGGLTASSNGYGSFATDNPMGSSTAFFSGGTGVRVWITYNADPGDQYFMVTDSANSAPWGIFRWVRPVGPVYPDRAFVSEWGRLDIGSNGHVTAITSIASSTVAYGAQTRTPANPADPYYIWTGSPGYSRSIYLGNMPPGIGRHGGTLTTGQTIGNGATEVWRVFGNQWAVREAL